MTFKPSPWPRKLRSQEWYGGTSRDNIYHRGWLKNQGYPHDLFDGRPVIGILNTWSDLTPCNGHLRELAEKVKAGVWEAGGFPLEVPVFSASENTYRPTAMMYRNLAALAVEETMRFDGPTQMMARTTTRDVTLHGVTIPAHSKVALLFTSANRDERKFADAEQFDVRRNARDHLGFGGGLHACLGAALARLEARVAMEEILAALGEFAVDETSLERMHSPNVRGLTREILTFTPDRK